MEHKIDIVSAGISVKTAEGRRGYSWEEIQNLSEFPIVGGVLQKSEIETFLTENGIDLESEEMQTIITEQKQAIEDEKPTAEEIKAQKERNAEDEARQIAIEELIAERTKTALDNVKSEIALGKIENARKAVRDEHKKLKG